MDRATKDQLPATVLMLLEKGVRIPAPFSVQIGDEVPVESISDRGVILHGGTRIFGRDTVIEAGAVLGREAPVTVEDCRIGPAAELGGGYFKGAVLLGGVKLAAGAHVREGCLLEEEVRAGHTVGLKQTILFPFVTLGSLVNLCDCLMAGGTDRKNHSEVGSSYVHFNYTPNGDKATCSILGDVPRGVMLDQPPIFLGGQGGLVGPARIGFGTVIAAGTVWQGDCPEGGRLLAGGGRPLSERPFHRGLYMDISRRVANNVVYIANLLALRQWYGHVRRLFFTGRGETFLQGALQVIEGALSERLGRLDGLAEGMALSQELAVRHLPAGEAENVVRRQRLFRERWPELAGCLTDRSEQKEGERERDEFLSRIASGTRAGYIETIRSLDEAGRLLGTAWLNRVVRYVWDRAAALLPFLEGEKGP